MCQEKTQGELFLEESKIRKLKKKKGVYFTNLTQDAIIMYNQEKDYLVRNEIYTKYIKKAFEKLIENLIYTFKFYNFDIPYHEFVHSAVVFLNEKMHYYTEDKGRAFSYFSVVGKHYLIFETRKNYEEQKIKQDLSSLDTGLLSVNDYYNKEVQNELSIFIDRFCIYLENNIHKFFTKDEEIHIVYAVLDLLKSRNDIEDFDKKYIYFILKEKTNIKTQKITRVLNKVKDIFYKKYQTYIRRK